MENVDTIQLIRAYIVENIGDDIEHVCSYEMLGPTIHIVYTYNPHYDFDPELRQDSELSICVLDYITWVFNKLNGQNKSNG